MMRIAIIGGGIAGVSAAYELALQQQAGAPVEFKLFEATQRLGGIVETERRDGFIVECGPDSWITEKPWACELAVELDLQSEIISSQDEHRRTYLVQDRTLVPMPDGMRMMVPVQWTSVLNSPLFSWQAKLAYLREPKRAEQLKASALDAVRPASDPRPDESIRDFVVRHFGVEVADTIAAPLLVGVFGGNIAKLSARAVLPAYVELERKHGSLILGLQQRAKQQQQSGAPVSSIFTTLKKGLSTLIEAMRSHIPALCIHCGTMVNAIEHDGDLWHLRASSSRNPADPASNYKSDALLIATPATTTRQLLTSLDARMAEYLPQQASSAIVVAFAFAAEHGLSMRIPRGFGFLVSQQSQTDLPLDSSLEALARRALLACTFVDQKFPHRAPPGAVLLRAFFGGPMAPSLLQENDASLLRLARGELGRILGKLPEPVFALVRRWPDSLPLYPVGHLDRVAALESRLALFPHIRLVGNAYRGVGLPDLIHAGRSAAREIIADFAGARTLGADSPLAASGHADEIP